MHSPIVYYTSDCRSGRWNGRYSSQLVQILEDRIYVVSSGNITTEQTVITGGVPQGSILEPLLLKIYMLPLAQIIENDNNINYITVSPEDYRLYSHWINVLNGMCQNFIQVK